MSLFHNVHVFFLASGQIVHTDIRMRRLTDIMLNKFEGDFLVSDSSD